MSERSCFTDCEHVTVIDGAHGVRREIKHFNAHYFVIVLQANKKETHSAVEGQGRRPLDGTGLAAPHQTLLSWDVDIHRIVGQKEVIKARSDMVDGVEQGGLGRDHSDSAT